MDYYRLTDKDTPVREENIGVWWDWICNAPAEWKTVERTIIDKHTEVVTVFFGKDDTMHEPETPPLLWRTELRQMDDCEVIWRYPTRAAAEFNHSRAVRNVRFERGEAGVVHERRNRSVTGRFRRFVKGIYKLAK